MSFAGQDADTFTNPVLPGFHPDPSICRIGKRFYLVTSSFEYYPGLPLFASDDLVSWEQLGHVLDRPSQIDLRGAPASGGLFAPTIRHHDGVFYVACTNVSAGGHFLVTTRDLDAGWSDPIWIDQNGIDPSLYFEGDAVYFTSNVQPDPAGPHELTPPFRRGIQQSRIDVRTGAVLEGPRFIWAGTGARYPEAPHLFRRGDYYYLLIAEGGTEYGHMASIGRSGSPWGPFEPSPYGPVINHRSTASPFQAMGHADFIELPADEWWTVCLGVRPSGGWPHHVLGREVFLAPVQWTADNWPVVGDHGRISAVLPRPQLRSPAPRTQPARDDFDDPRFAPTRTSVRGPAEGVSLGTRPGFLTLQPAGRPIEHSSPCFIGRRQQHHGFHAAAPIVFEEARDGDEAGLMVRMNETHFYALGVRCHRRGRQVLLRQRFGHIDLASVLGTFPPDKEITFTLRSDGIRYFFEAAAAHRRVAAQPVDVRFVSTEIAGGFTGAFIGLYATSLGNESGVAHVDWFEYRELPS